MVKHKTIQSAPAMIQGNIPMFNIYTPHMLADTDSGILTTISQTQIIL